MGAEQVRGRLRRLMKTTEFSLNGQTYHLCLNGAALFDIYEKYGSKGFVTDHVKGNGKKSFEATCWILAKLAEQGELVRRYLGHDRGPIPSEGLLRAMLSPRDVPEAKAAITEAVRRGFEREKKEDGPVDLGLLELEKKAKAP